MALLRQLSRASPGSSIRGALGVVGRLTAGAAATLLLGCDDASGRACEEDPTAQVLQETLELRILGPVESGNEGSGETSMALLATLPAERADELVERERGWRHRNCDRVALLMLQEATAPLAIWGCGLRAPISVAFIRDHEVVEVVEVLEPCADNCLACPIYGEDLAVDAVLELDHDEIVPAMGQRVEYDL